MRRARGLLIATSGFTQALAAGTVSAQNTFHDDFCQVFVGDYASCEDVGCASQGGVCTPTQGLDMNGTEIQGCICVGPQRPVQECQMVYDRDTQIPFCVDLSCPPLEAYSCDPVSCSCPGPNEVGDELCQPDQIDPTLCNDLGCIASGGICMRSSALFPDGLLHQVCHCEFDPQNDPIGSCAYLYHADVPDVRFCADLRCGNTDVFECAPALNCNCTCDMGPPLEVLGLRWSSKVRILWNHHTCATVYNVYRHQGPLTSYGPCLWNGLVAANVADDAVPPVGIVWYYLVTGESQLGEGTMGSTSGGVVRQNYGPCPTPPPLH